MKNFFKLVITALVAIYLLLSPAYSQTIDSLITGSKPESVKFADINKDGKSDIIVNVGIFMDSLNDATVQLFTNTGNSFQKTVLSYKRHALANSMKHYIEVYDVDQNTWPDIVVNCYDSLGIFFQDSLGGFTLTTTYVGEVVEKFSISSTGLIVMSTLNPNVIGLLEDGLPVTFIPVSFSAYENATFISDDVFVATGVSGAAKYFINTSQKTIDSVQLFSGVKNFCFNTQGDMITSTNTNGGVVYLNDGDAVPDSLFSFPFGFVPEAIEVKGTDILALKQNMLSVNGVVDTFGMYGFSQHMQAIAVGDVTGDGDLDYGFTLCDPMSGIKGIIFMNSGWGNFTSAENQEVQATSEIKIYPNPATDFVNIGNMPASVKEVILYDLLGKVVLSSTSATLDVRALPVGKYIIRIGEVRKKFIKIR